MLVKLIHGLAGESQSFRPRQIIKVSEQTAARFLSSGVAVEAPKGSTAEGELFDEHPDPEVQAAAMKQKAEEEKMRKTRSMESAVNAQAETPETGAGDGICRGLTSNGNPCAKKAVKGSEYCANHQDQG